MSKTRIHELAKELGTNSKELLDQLKSLGIEAKNHMSSVSQDEVVKLKGKLGVENKTNKLQSNTEGTNMQSGNTEPIKPAKDESGNSIKVDSQPTNVSTQSVKSETVSTNTSTNTSHSPRPQGDRPPYQGNRPQGDRPPYQGNRPQGDRPPYQGSRPQGDRPPYQGNRPQGDRPPYQGNRPQGDRPPYQGDRPQGDRPSYQGNRPQGDRPPYQGNRPQGDRPPYQGNRPQGDRPPYQGDRPQGDRPPYQGNRPQGDRPPYQGNRPQGDRPPYQGNRPQGDRPPYQGNRPQGDRPPYQGNRPQGDRPPYQGNRPQGDRPPYQGNRPQGGGYSNANGDKPRSFEKPKEKTSVSPIVGKPDKDQVRRLNKSPVKPPHGQTVYKKSEKPMEKPVLKNIVKLKPQPKPVSLEPKIIQIPAVITLKRLAEIMNLAGNDIIKSLIKKGMMITINEEIDFEKASEIAEEYNFLVEEEIEIDLFEKNFSEEPEKEEDLTERPPVVVVMGHVDHGKTSLLDCIRKASVTTGEAGGITQHIGAYTAKAKGKTITFLDTPGHAAFTAMRMRGAKITDIAILVVAADDGVMPQTIEAINHAKAAEVEIIVAINKMDKPSANPDRVKQELVEHGIIVEEFGGETICVPVSAMKNEGVDTLLEMIILTAEMKEYKANAKKKARGTIIEASLDKGRGPVATVLIQSGTLRVGDPIVANNCYGKIRAMTDDKGKSIQKAGPSKPVAILGLSDVPQAGEMFYVAENDKHARQVAEAFVAIGREEMTRASMQKVSLEDLFAQIKDGTIKDLNIIVKADVQGSVEAIRQSLEKLTNEEVRIRIIHGGVGAINESDIMLATTSGAIVIGFNVRPEVTAKVVAEEQGVDIRLYKVIYSAIEDIEAAMKGMLDPIYEEKIIGHAEIRQIFKSSGAGTIGGCYVTDGKIVRNAKARLLRDNAVVYEGTIDALKRFKDDAKEVRDGYECGISFNKYNDIKVSDIIEAFVMEQVER